MYYYIFIKIYVYLGKQTCTQTHTYIPQGAHLVISYLSAKLKYSNTPKQFTIQITYTENWVINFKIYLQTTDGPKLLRPETYLIFFALILGNNFN